MEGELIRRFDRIGVLVRVVMLVTSLWLGGSAAWAQTAVPAKGTDTDRLAALEKSSADQAAAIAAAQTAGDNSWMLASSALVLMMSGPGLALFYSGLVRRKNVLGTMMQTFAMMAVITVLWALVTYSLAFGEGNAFIGGLHNVFLHGVGLAPDPEVRGHDPAADLYGLPVDVCHHYPGTDYGSIRGAHEVLGHADLHGVVGHFCLQPDGAYGLGQRRLAQCFPGRTVPVPGFCRRHGGAHHLRSVGADDRALPG